MYISCKEVLSLPTLKSAEIVAGREGLKKANCSFLVDSPSNQIFPILENKQIEKLQEKFKFYVWQKVDDNHSAIRLITSWATKKEAVLEFLNEF